MPPPRGGQRCPPHPQPRSVRPGRETPLRLAHVGRALQIADRLGLGEATQALSLDILDRLDVGLVLVDARLRPLLVNASAEALVRSAGWLVLSQGCIRASEPAANARLEALVGAAAATSAGRALSSGGVMRLKGAGGTLPVLVAPFRTLVLELGPMAPVAALVFASAPRREIDAGVLSAVLGLSAAEARLLAALAGGASLVRYAEEAGISVNTAKTQIAAIFAKTGHSKQSTLVAEVSRTRSYGFAPSADRKGDRQARRLRGVAPQPLWDVDPIRWFSKP